MVDIGKKDISTLDIVVTQYFPNNKDVHQQIVERVKFALGLILTKKLTTESNVFPELPDLVIGYLGYNHDANTMPSPGVSSASPQALVASHQNININESI